MVGDGDDVTRRARLFTLDRRTLPNSVAMSELDRRRSDRSEPFASPQ